VAVMCRGSVVHVDVIDDGQIGLPHWAGRGRTRVPARQRDRAALGIPPRAGRHLRLVRDRPPVADRTTRARLPSAVSTALSAVSGVIAPTADKANRLRDPCQATQSNHDGALTAAPWTRPALARGGTISHVSCASGHTGHPRLMGLRKTLG
jgi:hypothetical protein